MSLTFVSNKIIKIKGGANTTVIVKWDINDIHNWSISL